MNFIFVVFVVALACTSAVAQSLPSLPSRTTLTPVTISKNAVECTASGDPHTKSFDGVYWDFQGYGEFYFVQNEYVNIQYADQRCNLGAATPVYCIYAVAVKLTHYFTGANSTIIVPAWPPTTSSLAKVNVTIDGVNHTATSLVNGTSTANQAAQVLYKNNQIYITSYVSSCPFQIIVGYQAFAVLLDSPTVFLGNVKGLCGYYSNQAADEFTCANNSLAKGVANTIVKGGRYDNTAVNQWGATYAVTTATSFFTVHSKWDSLSNSYYLQDETSAAVIPTDDEQSALNNVDFATINSAVTSCQANSLSGDEESIHNCAYDYAVLEDSVLASTNDAITYSVQQAKLSSSDNSLSAGDIAGIVLGSIAGVTLIALAILYYRFHKLRAAYSRALIVRDQPRDTNVPAATLADNL